jgi:hypothetical protein
MENYLDKYKDSIRPKQIEQILKILSKQKDQGQIRNLDEFTQKFDSLVRELTDVTLAPTLKTFPAKDLINSEVHNEMLDRTEDDLVSLFTEANSLEAIQSIHESVITDNVIKKIKDNYLELDLKLQAYNYIKNNPYGFNRFIGSTFQSSINYQLDKNKDTDSLFIDPRISKNFDEDQIAQILGNENQLTLRNALKEFKDICGVEEIEDNLNVEDTGIYDTTYFGLANLTDNREDTFWSKEVISLENVAYKTVTLKLNLKGYESINFLELHTPFDKTNLYLYSIKYIDIANQEQDLLTPDKLIFSNEIFRFRLISTNTLILEFRVKDGIYFENKFIKNAEWNNIPVDIGIYETLKQSISSNVLSENSLPAISQTEEIVKGWKYTFNISSVKCGNIEYKPKTVYISTPFEATNVINAGLKVNYQIPVITNSDVFLYDTNLETYAQLPTAGIKFFGNIEYYLIKEGLDELGNRLNLSFIRMFPLNEEYVNEEIILTEKNHPSNLTNNIGYLSFYCPNDSNLSIRKNDLEWLTAPSWDFESSIEDETPGTGQKMRTKIEIISPFYSDVYTAWTKLYTSTSIALPKVLGKYDPPDYPFSIIDLTGDLSARLQEDNVILIDKEKEKTRISKYRFYLMIILKNSSASMGMTPIVDDYILYFNVENA